jgi:hypothetical protein
VHPELFELKALVAGRLDAHRRREIDDHLGSCADCSRHYVALMLGSSSPKTAEAEARAGLVPQGSGTVLTLGGGSQATVEVYGIDAPLPPSVKKPPTRTGITLETEFPPANARTQVPISASLVDAIARLRAESEATRPTKTGEIPMPTLPTRTGEIPLAKVPTPTLQPRVVAPVAESALIEPSIFTPTPAGGISIIRGERTPSSSRLAAELPAFITRPSPSASMAAQPELVVTFSSTPSRSPSYRSPSFVSVVTPSADRAYVSQAVPNLATQPRPDIHVTETTVARKPVSMTMGLLMVGVALASVLVLSAYRYFQTSVAEAASAAATQAAQRVQAAAASAQLPAPVVAAPAPPPQVQTRIVYVREPAKKTSDAHPVETPAPSTAPVPVAISLPDVNITTGGAESAMQTNTQRSVTSELTRSARATSTRTAAPRPY